MYTCSLWQTEVSSALILPFPCPPACSGPIQSFSPWTESSELHLGYIFTMPIRSCLSFPRHLLHPKLMIRHESPKIWWLHQPWDLPFTPFVFAKKQEYILLVTGCFWPWFLFILTLTDHQNHRWYPTGLFVYSASCPKWSLLVSEKCSQYSAGGLILCTKHVLCFNGEPVTNFIFLLNSESIKERESDHGFQSVLLIHTSSYFKTKEL